MWEELEKEVDQVIKEVDEKIAELDAFFEKYPYRTTLATHPPEVVEEEDRLRREFREVRDRFYAVFTKVLVALNKDL